MLAYINQSNNCLYLTIVLKVKKAVLLLIPEDITIEEKLLKTMNVTTNFCDEKKYKKCYC